jgi:hypothetical protein
VPSRWELIFRMFGKEKCLHWVQNQKQMTAEQNIKEIEALPQRERERLVQRMPRAWIGCNPPGFHRRP